jgi:hypothetical protein
MAGDVPQYITVEGNHIHDIGVHGKQTSAWFQTISARNTVRNNVMYNGPRYVCIDTILHSLYPVHTTNMNNVMYIGPRAAINLNDGYGGGNMVENNLLFGWVRETR